MFKELTNIPEVLTMLKLIKNIVHPAFLCLFQQKSHEIDQKCDLIAENHKARTVNFEDCMLHNHDLFAKYAQIRFKTHANLLDTYFDYENGS